MIWFQGPAVGNALQVNPSKMEGIIVPVSFVVGWQVFSLTACHALEKTIKKAKPAFGVVHCNHQAPM